MLSLMWRFTPGQPEENAFRCSCNCLLHFAEKCYVVFSAFSLSVRWLDVAESKEKQQSVTQVLDRGMNSSGVVWGSVWVRAEGWKCERGGMSQTSDSESGVCLFWSGLLTIATYAHCDLSRSLAKHKQLWKLLFLLIAEFGYRKHNSAIVNWYY